MLGQVGSSGSPTTKGRPNSGSSTNQTNRTVVDPLKLEVQRLVERNKDNQFFAYGEHAGKDEKQVKEEKTIWNCLKSLRVVTMFTLVALFTLMIVAFVIIVGVIFPVSFGVLEKDESSNASRRMMKVMYDDLSGNLRVGIMSQLRLLTHFRICCHFLHGMFLST